MACALLSQRSCVSPIARSSSRRSLSLDVRGIARRRCGRLGRRDRHRRRDRLGRRRRLGRLVRRYRHARAHAPPGTDVLRREPIVHLDAASLADDGVGRGADAGVGRMRPRLRDLRRHPLPRASGHRLPGGELGRRRHQLRPHLGWQLYGDRRVRAERRLRGYLLHGLEVRSRGTYVARFCATPGTLGTSDGGPPVCTPTGPQECVEVPFAFPSSQPVVITLPTD